MLILVQFQNNLSSPPFARSSVIPTGATRSECSGGTCSVGGRNDSKAVWDRCGMAFSALQAHQQKQVPPLRFAPVGMTR